MRNVKRQNYVTAFPGRRDSYQIPVALAEHDRLTAFITCFYRERGLVGKVASLSGLGKRLFARREARGLPAEKVKTLEFINGLTRLGQKIIQPSRITVGEDIAFARRAVHLAQKTQSSLLLYEFQADWAFRQPLPKGTVKILFQFHPHPDLEHPLLLADGARYPDLLPSIQSNTRNNLPLFYREHTRNAWRHADHIIVASQFTARSLEVAGCPTERITIVPYGCSLGDYSGGKKKLQPKPYFLFVGAGIHRKGLHHLLEAWGKSKVRDTHELVVIARVVDREISARMKAVVGVRHIKGVGPEELNAWFSGAQAFVLPSLSEGFGHVFLEALACGCPVIGTRNSMLPDFTAAQPHIRYVEPGDPAGIREAMEKVAALPPHAPFYNVGKIRESVKSYTWQGFRDGVEAVLARFD